MNKKYTLKEIAEYLNAELRGDSDCQITGIGSLPKADPSQISFLAKVPGFAGNFSKFLPMSKAGAVILSVADAKNFAGNALIVADPYASYAKVTALFDNVNTNVFFINFSC